MRCPKIKTKKPACTQAMFLTKVKLNAKKMQINLILFHYPDIRRGVIIITQIYWLDLLSFNFSYFKCIKLEKIEIYV